MRIPDFLCILNHHLSPVFLPALPSPKPFLYPRKHALSLRQVLLVEIRYHGIGWLVKIIAKFSMQTAVLPRRNKPKPVLRFWLILFSIVGLADAACSVSYRMLMQDARLASPLLAENVPYFLPIRKKFLFCCAKPEKRLIKRDYSAGYSFSQPVLTDKEAGQPDDSLLPDNTFRQYHRLRSETGLFPSIKSDPDCSKTVCGTAVSPSEENASPAQCPSCR